MYILLGLLVVSLMGYFSFRLHCRHKYALASLRSVDALYGEGQKALEPAEEDKAKKHNIEKDNKKTAKELKLALQEILKKDKASHEEGLHENDLEKVRDENALEKVRDENALLKTRNDQLISQLQGSPKHISWRAMNFEMAQQTIEMSPERAAEIESLVGFWARAARYETAKDHRKDVLKEGLHIAKELDRPKELPAKDQISDLIVPLDARYTYTTTDLHIGAYLECANVDFLGTEPEVEGKRVFLIYNRSPGHSKLLDEYFNGKGKVSALEFSHHLKNLKRFMSDLDQPNETPAALTKDQLMEETYKTSDPILGAFLMCFGYKPLRAEKDKDSEIYLFFKDSDYRGLQQYVKAYHEGQGKGIYQSEKFFENSIKISELIDQPTYRC